MYPGFKEMKGSPIISSKILKLSITTPMTYSYLEVFIPLLLSKIIYVILYEIVSYDCYAQ